MDLRGGSAEALAALRGRVDAVGSDAAAQVGADLAEVAGVLRSEAGLRRVATDQTVEASAKAGLVREVFGGKIGQASLDIVADAVGHRWIAARDLADTLDYLGVVATVRSSAPDTARLTEELFAFSEVVSGNDGLRNALSDPVRTVADKATLVHALLDGKALPSTVRLAVQALDGSHRTVTGALQEYQQIAADVDGKVVAQVRVAQPLRDEDARRLAAALAGQYGRPVHLNVIVEPDLVGGMRVEIGDDVIDGSLSARIDDAKRRLAG